jgi:glucosyl-dolichyl phosphate glucuronosyltransferase
LPTSEIAFVKISDHSVSILITTCNRALNLLQVLETLAKVRIPVGWKAEVIVVDNASADDTALVIQRARLPNMELTYLYEPKQGKSNALNSALARARGEIILFTDDDTVIPGDWLEQMLACFQKNQCDAVVGRIQLSPHLVRAWMTASFEGLLAVSEHTSGPLELIGANAGFRRHVLNRVHGFDTELGPGALGLGEDTLFSWQLVESGFRLVYSASTSVVHQPEKSRLLRCAWLESARKLGRSRAYLRYHWLHSDLRLPRLQWLWLWMKLKVRRLLQPPQPLDAEGCPPWELSYVWHMEMYKQFCVERRRPRNYARRGLTKRNPSGTGFEGIGCQSNAVVLPSP